MIKSFVLLLALGLSGPLAFAQSATPPASSQPSYSREEARDVRRKAARECRNELDPRSMTGPERRNAMRDCVRGKLPESLRAQGSGMREVRRECRDDVRAKGLRGPERRDAMDACIRQKRPDLAKRLDCQKEARGKGLRGPERRDFMRGCAA